MERHDPAPLLAPRDIIAAAALLTRLPLPVMAAEHHRGAHTAWAYPLIGAGLGAISALIGIVAIFIGLPVFAASVLVLMTPILLTGALHEDGLADTADGLWGGSTPERRLEIMRDHQIGSYGTLALILVQLLKLSALLTLLATASWLALIAAAALSRAAMPAVMWALPNARKDGLSAATGRPAPTTVWVALALGTVIALVATAWWAIAAIAVAAAIAFILAVRAKALIGGQTGDILGATQCLTETAALLTFAAAMSSA